MDAMSGFRATVASPLVITAGCVDEVEDDAAGDVTKTAGRALALTAMPTTSADKAAAATEMRTTRADGCMLNNLLATPTTRCIGR
jgi:hypothetical protein